MAPTVVGADRLSRVWLAISWGIVLAALPSMSRAEESAPVVLRWQTPPDAQCASAEEMRERVARLTERPLVLSGGTRGHRIEAVVSPNGSTWQATVRLVDGAGRPQAVRWVEGRTPNCGGVDVAAAVVIATMLDGLPVQATPLRKEPEASAAADGGGALLGAFVAVSPGLIPRAWFGGGLELVLEWAVPVLIEATVYAPASEQDSQGRGARLWGFHAGGGICPSVVEAGPFDLRLCASAQAGVQFASGVGLTSNLDSELPLVMLKLGPRLLCHVEKSFSVQLGMSAAWVVLRPRVHWEIEGESPRSLRSDPIALLAQFGFVISMQ